jgi:hypothetical protein
MIPTHLSLPALTFSDGRVCRFCLSAYHNGYVSSQEPTTAPRQKNSRLTEVKGGLES